MKPLLFIMLAMLAVGCSKETLAPTTPLQEMLNENIAMPITGGGNFQNGPYGAVTGTARLYKNEDGSYSVTLENFNTSNGPDLYVYLSKQPMPVEFIEAGKLKSTSGNQVYPINSAGDLSGYKYVCIHCKAFNHLFGYALLN